MISYNIIRIRHYFADMILRNEKFCLLRCIVLFEGDEVVKVEKRAKKDKEECEKFEKANVCVSKHSDSKAGVYACQLSIDDMNEDLEGNWFKSKTSTKYYNNIVLFYIYVDKI